MTGRITIVFIIICTLFHTSPLSAKKKEVIGWLEMVRVFPGNLKIRAKLDTGAKVSSLNASNLEYLHINDKRWIRFKLYIRDKIATTIEKQVLKTVSIKKRDGGVEERPVIKIGICIGNVFKEIEVNLIDRSNLNYQLLIGRHDSKSMYLIDPLLTFTKEPTCKPTPEYTDSKTKKNSEENKNNH